LSQQRFAKLHYTALAERYSGEKWISIGCNLPVISAEYFCMRQFILTILIISNIGAGFEVASDYDDTWAQIDILTVVDGLQSSLADSGSVPADEAICDHCCHAAAHFTGAITSCLVLPYIRSSSDAIFTGTPYQFYGRSPPTPPPNV